MHLSEKMATRRWVFWLDHMHPDPNDRPGVYRVSVVFENEAGHSPTGGGEADPLKSPWYWDKETCEQQNRERGYTEEQTLQIVFSSIALSRCKG